MRFEGEQVRLCLAGEVDDRAVTRGQEGAQLRDGGSREARAAEQGTLGLGADEVRERRLGPALFPEPAECEPRLLAE